MAKKKCKTNRKPSRRRRKPKYLSLRLQFSSDNSPKSNDIPLPSICTTDHHQQQQLYLEDDENMAYLLSPVSDGGATTFTDLIGVTTASSSVNNGADEFSPSASISNYYESVKLVRTAFRSKLERDRSEERYVRYSEVVEEVSSSRVAAGDDQKTMSRLSLKLDYEEIMSAWSDKGPLYIQSDLPQTVPDIYDDFFSDHQDLSIVGLLNNGFVNGSSGGGGRLWRVPEENGGGEEHQSLKVKEELSPFVAVGEGEDMEQWKWKVGGGQREASLLRYKEKRRSRLFSKTIRYHVRKLNAEKRPRVKGRFVKRS